MWVLVQSVRAEVAVEDSRLVVWVPEVRGGSFGWVEGCRANPEEVALLNGPRCDGSYLWEGFKALCLIGTWEAARCCVVNCRRRSGNNRETASQTHSSNVVPMPLVKGVPNRADILFSLWIAGYRVDAEAREFSEGVRNRFHRLVGGYLRRLEVDGVGFSDEGSSSDAPE